MAIISAFVNISRGQPPFISWLRDHLIPCPFKYLTGLDCPGCGFQRAVLALIDGNFSESFKLYPPTIPLLLFFIYGSAGRFFKMDNQKDTVKKSMFFIVGWIILLSYGFKLWGIYTRYISSAAVAAAM